MHDLTLQGLIQWHTLQGECLADEAKWLQDVADSIPHDINDKEQDDASLTRQRSEHHLKTAETLRAFRSALLFYGLPGNYLRRPIPRVVGDDCRGTKLGDSAVHEDCGNIARRVLKEMENE